MPIFDYRCLSCGAEFERLTLFHTADAQRCSACGASAVRRPSAPAFAVHGYNAQNRYTDRRLFAVQPDGSVEKK
jgi:putative FmdB family regulatory protein